MCDIMVVVTSGTIRAAATDIVAMDMAVPPPALCWDKRYRSLFNPHYIPDYPRNGLGYE